MSKRLITAPVRSIVDTDYRWTWLPDEHAKPARLRTDDNVVDGLLEAGSPRIRISVRQSRTAAPGVLYEGDISGALREFALECAMSTLDIWVAPDIVEEYLLRRDPRDQADAADAARPSAYWYLQALTNVEYAQLISAAAIAEPPLAAARLAWLFMPRLYGSAAGGVQARRRLRRLLATKLLYQAAAG